MDSYIDTESSCKAPLHKRLWQAATRGFAFMRADHDLDPDRTIVNWWRARLDDLLTGAKTFFKVLTFAGGLSFATLLSARSPLLLQAAEFIFTHSVTAMIYAGCGYALLYLFKIGDIVNVYSPMTSTLSKDLQLKRLIVSIGVFCLVLAGAGYSFGMPLLAVYQARIAVPEVARILRCEAEHSNMLQNAKYVPSVDCWDTIDELNSPVRMAPRPKEITPYFGE